MTTVNANTRTLLRGARVLLQQELLDDGRPRDVLIVGDRIAAIEPAGTIEAADRIVALDRHRRPNVGERRVGDLPP